MIDSMIQNQQEEDPWDTLDKLLAYTIASVVLVIVFTVAALLLTI